jgi:hypothetical protein
MKKRPAELPPYPGTEIDNTVQWGVGIFCFISAGLIVFAWYMEHTGQLCS